MLPVGMLYMLVKYYMADDLNGRGGFFAIGCIACLILIAVTTYIQYNATFLNTYIESGVRDVYKRQEPCQMPGKVC